MVDAIEQLIKTTAPRGSSLYYSLLFTAEKQRKAIIALAALQLELRRMTEQYHERSVIQTKLAWWRDETQRVYQQQVASHPIMQALLPAIAEYQLPQQLFMEWIDGALLKLDSDHLCTEADFAAFCYRESGVWYMLAAYVLGFTSHTSLQGLQDLAIAHDAVRIMQDMRPLLQRGVCYIPLVYLDEAGVTEEMLQSGVMSPALENALTRMWQCAQSHYQTALRAVSDADKKALKPLFTYTLLSMKLGNLLAKHHFPVLTEITQLTPLYKLYLAWRKS